jgi:hypothetical protein
MAGSCPQDMIEFQIHVKGATHLPEVHQFVGVADTAWRRAFTRLKEVGVFADEERDFLSAQTVQSLLPQIEQKLRSLGYSGGQLDVMVFDAPREGATYLLFDKNRIAGLAAAENLWRDDYERRWQKRVTTRVEGWLRRLAALRQTFEQWIAGSQTDGLRIVDKQPASMHEEPMRRFGVGPAEMPVYEIERNGVRLMRVQPKGLWVIGANGRVDLVTRTASLILVDASDPESTDPNWEVYQSHERRHSIPLNREVFLDLLQQAAA